MINAIPYPFYDKKGALEELMDRCLRRTDVGSPAFHSSLWYQCAVPHWHCTCADLLQNSHISMVKKNVFPVNYSNIKVAWADVLHRHLGHFKTDPCTPYSSGLLKCSAFYHYQSKKLTISRQMLCSFLGGTQ